MLACGPGLTGRQEGRQEGKQAGGKAGWREPAGRQEHAGRQTGRQAGRLVCRQASKQTGRQEDKQAGRQASYHSKIQIDQSLFYAKQARSFRILVMMIVAKLILQNPKEMKAMNHILVMMIAA